MEYGIQMYSVRDITEKDLEGALYQVADLGYKFVEFAGFFGRKAALGAYHNAYAFRAFPLQNAL